MLQKIAVFCWGPWTLGFFFVTGLYFSFQTGFFQLFGFFKWLPAVLRGLRSSRQGGLSPLRTVSTALAAAIGTGSIAGVATALTLGGPGAIFWMEISALLGMMTGCAEKILAIKLREPRLDGSWRGGPMVWLAHAGHTGLAKLFALCAILSSLCMGAMVQSNSIATGLHAAFDAPLLLTGLVTAGLAGLSLRSGLRTAGAVCERMVPLMASAFLLAGSGILILRRAFLLPAAEEVLSHAFTLEAGIGGTFGTALRCGIARGVFTNEAGLGTTAMIHANSSTTDPATEGLRGIFEVFVSTMLVCTISAFVLLTTVYPSTTQTGAALCFAAFRSVLGQPGTWLLSCCLTLFAFSSILGSFTYGQLGLEFLGLHHISKYYLPLFLGAVVGGTVIDVTHVWELADLSTAWMAWPALISLWIYRASILQVLQQVRQHL